MLGEECFYLTPLPAPKPTNFVLYETRDYNLVKFGNQVKVDQLCGRVAISNQIESLFLTFPPLR